MQKFLGVGGCFAKIYGGAAVLWKIFWVCFDAVENFLGVGACCTKFFGCEGVLCKIFWMWVGAV